MKRSTIVVLSLLILGQSSPVQSRVITAGAAQTNIPIYENSVLSKSYEVIGKVTVTATASNDLQDEMIKKARRYGGDAIVQFKVLEPGSVEDVGLLQSQSRPTKVIQVGSQNKPSAVGVIIKFVDKGGVTTIDDTTTMPVLK